MSIEEQAAYDRKISTKTFSFLDNGDLEMATIELCVQAFEVLKKDKKAERSVLDYLNSRYGHTS